MRVMDKPIKAIVEWFPLSFIQVEHAAYEGVNKTFCGLNAPKNRKRFYLDYLKYARCEKCEKLLNEIETPEDWLQHWKGKLLWK